MLNIFADLHPKLDKPFDSYRETNGPTESKIELKLQNSLRSFNFRNTVKNVIKMYEEQNLVPHICDRFPLEQINEALKHFETGKTSGKLVINIKE